MMPHWLTGGLVVAAAGALLAACGSDSTPTSGVPPVIVQDETLQAVPGNLCAVTGKATNTGAIRVHVVVTHEARSAAGAVIGTSTATFDVDPFQSFVFQPAQPNATGQPSSSVFTGNLACGAIASFKVTALDVTGV